MAKRITVVVSQGQSQNPAKRKLEEDLVARLIGERGIEVTVIPHLYDLAPDGTGMLCLQGIGGDMIVLSWLYLRAAHWILNRNDIRGHVGTTLLIEETDEEDEQRPDEEEIKDRVVDQLAIPPRTIYCIDLRVRNNVDDYMQEIHRIVEEASVQTVELGGWIGGDPKPEQMKRFIQPTPGNVDAAASGNGKSSGHADANGNGKAVAATRPTETSPPVVIEEAAARRWYPVIDFSRCTNCMECIDFCLFGVYGVDSVDTILVEQPDNCRKGCPACSRVCPENAIIFPQHKTPAIAGSPEMAGGLKIDLSKLFGAPEADAVDVAVRERDEQLVMVGRDAVGHEIGLRRRQTENSDRPKDELDDLMDELDELDL